MKVVAAVIAALLAVPAVCAAADSGRAKDVRAIRADAPVLLAARLRTSKIDPATLHVDDVAVEGADALVGWSAGNVRGIDGFSYRWDRWWDLMQTRGATAQGLTFTCAQPFTCDSSRRVVPSAQTLAALGVPRTLLNAAAGFSRITRAQDVSESWGAGSDPAPPALGSDGTIARDSGDGYDAVIRIARTDAKTPVPYRFSIRQPTQAESWNNYPGGNAWAYFVLDVHNDTPIAVQSGTTVDIWCPFVLDSDRTYTLTIAARHFSIAPSAAAVRANTLHMELPAFTIPPSEELFGEIDDNGPHASR
ncbi:MAG TPA: hypothetical protein VGN11_09495, partial [Candidatus Baltobacteraceae bacterium]|nr:hypothetical protein [Candidatus Baltobacteraceae bacterium]